MNKHVGFALAITTGRFFVIIACCMMALACQKTPDDPVVAAWDAHRITLADFRTAYLRVLKQPEKFDSPELREAFLDEMINRVLLAGQARLQGLDQDERYRLKREAYYGKCLRDAHYKQVIAPTLRLDDELLKEVYRYTHEQRHIRHLFYRTRAAADSAWQLLQQGASFDQLAATTFRNSELAANGGDLGWVYWDQLDYDLAMAAFRRKPGSYSAPVRSSHGYHIIRVENARYNPLLDTYDFAIHRDKIKAMVETKMGEMRALDYIRTMMDQADVKLRTPEFALVGRALKRWWLAQTDSSRLAPDSSDVEQPELTPDLWEVRNNPLCIINGEPMTVGWFISNLAYIPRAIVRKNVRAALDYSIRDFLLSRDAERRGLGNTPAVKRDVQLFEDYLLQLMLRRQLVRSVTVSEADLQARFAALVAGKQTTTRYTDFRDELEHIVRREKRADVVPATIRKLRAPHHIVKKVAPIHAYYDQFR